MTMNMWWTENATRKTSGIGGLAVEQALSVFAQPGETVDFHYAIAPPGPLRVLGMFGHRHAWTTNFSAWIERQGKPPELVYQSFDWFDEPTYQYNSQVQTRVLRTRPAVTVGFQAYSRSKRAIKSTSTATSNTRTRAPKK